MKWEGREESENVEDRRGMGPKVALAGGGGLVVLILALLLGVDKDQLAKLVGQGQQNQGQQQGPNQPHQPANPVEEKAAKFSKVIFHDTEEIWTEQFQKQVGRPYQKPVLVLFSDQVASACGEADSAVGPFYCSGDHRVYIDLGFYRDMERKLNAPGEFARAYVIAHEVGHHVQNLLGYSKRVHEAKRTQSPAEANKMSVRLELQADFLAGVWAHHAQKKFNFLEAGDVESALNAAFEIGDDRLQKKARGFVVPDSFTHGTSKQRQKWFQDGFKTGDINRAKLLFDLPYNEL